MDDLKKQFNDLTRRINKAEKWWDLETTTQEERDERWPTLVDLINERDVIAYKLSELGYKVRVEEFWYGIEEGVKCIKQLQINHLKCYRTRKSASI